MARTRSRTRRVTRRRGGAGIEYFLRSPEGQLALQKALQLGKRAATSPEARALAGQALQSAKGFYNSTKGQELRQQAMREFFRGGKTHRSRRRLEK